MSFYRLGDHFKWFIARVSDIKDPKKLGRVKIRIIHTQTGELGKKESTGGISNGIIDDDLLWAWPLSAVQSASLSWRKVVEMENFDTPDWIDAVGLSPTGIALSTYVFGFFLDGHDENIPIIFGSYHKESRFPEPETDIPTGVKSMLQLKQNPGPQYFYNDVAALARGEFQDDEVNLSGSGQTLPKEPYAISKLWKPGFADHAPVDEFPTAYNTTYPYNTTYTTKSGHAIELDDTPGHERIHIWHRSGCYEEISNGPSPFVDGDTRSFSQGRGWPKNGPAGYSYVTAGGVVENDYKGRRSRKTMDSFFDAINKDHNELIKRDHNVEVGNTETVKIGNNCHWTVGWQQPPANRKNDNGKTPYVSGGLDKYNLYFDVANNSVYTTVNNYVSGVGYQPKNERRLVSKDKYNYYIDVANNTTQTTGNNFVQAIGFMHGGEWKLSSSDVNNHYIQVANNQTIKIGNNQVTEISGNQTTLVLDQHILTVEGSSFIDVDQEINISSGTGIKIKSDAGVTIYGTTLVEGALGTTSGANGTFTTSDGKRVVVLNGIVTDIN